MHDLQKHFAIFLCFHILFWKIYLGSFVLISLCFCSKKKGTFKGWRGSLYFSQFLLLNLFSFLCPIFMFTLLVGTLLTHLAFSLFSPFFSFHVSSPQVCLSLCLFTLSLSLVLLLLSLFFLKNHIGLIFRYFF